MNVIVSTGKSSWNDCNTNIISKIYHQFIIITSDASNSIYLAILSSNDAFFARLSCLSISFSIPFHRFIIRKNNGSPFRNTFTPCYEWFRTPYGWPRERQIDETRNEIMCINRETLSNILNKKHRADLFVRLNCNMKTNWCWQFAEKRSIEQERERVIQTKNERGEENEEDDDDERTRARAKATTQSKQWTNEIKERKKQLSDALTEEKKKKKSA